MSENFIQYTFPCKECIVQSICKDGEQAIENIKHGLIDRPSLAVPRFKDPDKSYHKGLIECWANIGIQIINGMMKSEDSNGKEVHNNIPYRYVCAIQQMTNIMGYMVNSTSWEKGETFEFDRTELARRLKHVKGWLS